LTSGHGTFEATGNQQCVAGKFNRPSLNATGMSSATSPLTEPQVLAHTKRRLFPGDDHGTDDTGYVVADTQFTTGSWLDSGTVDSALREQLAPFNHVQVGSGYPDLVGVGHLETELLAVERLGTEPPLVAVEAKGETQQGVDVERGVVQAHDRLGEANVAFVAAPSAAIGSPARALARELNVGVLGVHDDGMVTPLEAARVVGNRSSTEMNAVRFQASAQGVARQSFGLNHPKNYLGYAVAVAHPEDTASVVADRVVGAVEDARRGAAFLGLVESAPDEVRLTGLGEEVVRFALREYGSVDAALAEFEGWQGSRRRFTEAAPRWAQLARRVVYDYPATELLVGELQRMHADGIADPTLVQLVEWLHELHPSFTVELFVRGTDDVRRRVLDAEGRLQRAALTDGEVYHAPTVFQLKAMLFHAGVLTERGAEPNKLAPEGDVWRLRESVR
jgi:hypothetical protein